MNTDPSAAGNASTRAQPESFRARAVSPSLTVKDIQKSLAFYRDVLGFTVDEQYERDGRLQAVSLKAGGVRILLGLDDGKKGFDRVKGEGFSLQFTTAQNVDELAQRIKERGGTLDTEPMDGWGARAFRVRDPDGFKLTISSERSPSR
jgi:lactoylglutathione lyase